LIAREPKKRDQIGTRPAYKEAPMSLFSVDGKVALVTGAASGIGAAIARGLAEAGADVVCHGNRRRADDTVAAVRALGRQSVAVEGDLAEGATPGRIVDEALQAFGRIDILVNNAGMITRAPALEVSELDWSSVLTVNLTSAFALCQRVGRGMVERGSGKIVNVASLLSFQGGIRVPAYAASKGGLAQLTKALANEWGSRNVNVNAIAPGYIRTTNTAALAADPDRNRQILERIPAGRWGEAHDLIGAVVFLCSRASDYVHGHVLAVDGGWLSR
jgi:2-dehydro-3-deoxy-D-gluconate 5-dehydrogenase